MVGGDDLSLRRGYLSQKDPKFDKNVNFSTVALHIVARHRRRLLVTLAMKAAF